MKRWGFSVWVLLLSLPAMADVPALIDYQGDVRAAGGAPVADGQYAMRFQLFGTETGGVPLWTELRTGASRVQMTSGLFRVQLGEISPFSPVLFGSGTTLWLELAIDSNNNAAIEAGEVFAPRSRLASAPFALEADLLDGYHKTDLDGEYVNEGQPNAIDSAMVKDESLMAADLGPDCVGASELVAAYETGSAYDARFVNTSGDTVSGSFTVDDTTFHVDSLNNRVGIGTTSPSRTLHVNGEIEMPADTWLYSGGRKALRNSYLAGSATSRVLQVGETGTNQALALGVDLTANPSAQLNGNEIILPNNRAVIAVNAANNGYLGVLGVDSANRLHVGATGYNVLGSNTMVINTQNGFVGLGTSSPAGPLHVRDTGGRQTLFVDAATAGWWNGIMWSDAGTNAFAINKEGNKDMTLWVYPSGNPLRVLVVKHATGRVGILRDPTTVAFEVEGEASKTTPGSWLANSDARIKRDIQSLDGALQTVRRLRPVRFRYTEEYRQAHPSVKDQPYYSFVAQEYAQVFPEGVQEDGEGYLLLDTQAVQPHLVRAVQEIEQRAVLDQQVGSVMVPRGQRQVRVTFRKPFARPPIVVASPTDDNEDVFVNWKIARKSTMGFGIVLESAQKRNVTFDWIATPGE